jgi:hypothetical protein
MYTLLRDQPGRISGWHLMWPIIRYRLRGKTLLTADPLLTSADPRRATNRSAASGASSPRMSPPLPLVPKVGARCSSSRRSASPYPQGDPGRRHSPARTTDDPHLANCVHPSRQGSLSDASRSPTGWSVPLLPDCPRFALTRTIISRNGM